MKLTKLLALLIVTVLALSACTKSALRKDLLEYTMFKDTLKKAEWSAFEQADGLLLGKIAPFEHNKDILLDMTTEVLEKWRDFKIDNARVQNLADLKVQEWEQWYAAFEKLDEAMLVVNNNTSSQDSLNEKIDSLVDGKISAVQQEHRDTLYDLWQEIDFSNYRGWKKYYDSIPLWEYAD